jgi:transposase InsO family protein
MGYPSKQGLRDWVDELAPGQRKVSKLMTEAGKVEYTYEQKRDAVIDMCARREAARIIAEKHGIDRDTLYRWKYDLLGKEAPASMPKDNAKTAEETVESLRADIDALKTSKAELEREVYRLNMEKDILEVAAELIKKDPGVNPASLTNAEKTMLIDALRPRYRLDDLLKSLSISKSSYFYQHKCQQGPDKYAEIRSSVIEVFEENDGCYGYRRVHMVLHRDGTVISEKVIQRIMREEGLVVIGKKKRKYSSYKGEISPEVANVLERDFNADAPNEKWLTDLTEFHIPAGKVYLSPIIDCFDGKAVAWTIGTSPDAELVNTMLDLGLASVDETSKLIIHSDRGCHYRWPGWIERCDKSGITRSMSKKGCSPDNAACEGFFGRLKNEFFYGRSWQGVGIEEFMGRLDRYMHWYNEKRIKMSLGGVTILEYRQAYEYKMAA